MASAQTFRELSIDAGATWNADYVRGCDVTVSTDGTSWTNVASASGTAQVVVIDFAPMTVSARYVRLTLNSGATSTTHWWSIAEFNVKN